ncbi:peptidoglycan-binding domain-containing protein [Pseudodesulfovibrio methanolicus]|uniref:Peptidoglycan binding-like domain-containing protein n=1 Tax=Pseudodesulfovibrio methanolicus TaxID=3126690 RepID=A0ABZ2J0X9_9BACT
MVLYLSSFLITMNVGFMFQAAYPLFARRGPVAPGRALRGRSLRARLDLTNPADVRVIQQRFKAIGLYSMAEDGTIGPGTRQAFDVFADRHNLQRGLWTVNMQMLLFRGARL